MNKSESKYFNTALRMDKAFIEILETKDFEYITVKEICDKAGVNRSTFYLHYNNTVDLLEETGKYLKEEFLSYFSCNLDKLKAEKPIEKIHTCDLSELNFISDDYIVPFLTYVFDNKRVFATVLSHGNSFDFNSSFERMFEHIFDPILSRFHYPEKFRRLVMMFYLNGIIAVITGWLKGNCAESIPEISKIIISCIYGLNADFDSHIKKLNVE